MTIHPRIPAFITFLAASAVGLGLLEATGQFNATDLQKETLDELEKRIVDCKDSAVWIAYGDKLQAAKRFSAAAVAYEKASAIDPESVDARKSVAIALAQANMPDKFFAYFSKLTSSYPKQAVELLEVPQLGPVKGDARWEPAASAARAQAVD